jgi:hypothetical protein
VKVGDLVKFVRAESDAVLLVYATYQDKRTTCVFLTDSSGGKRGGFHPSHLEVVSEGR